MAAAAGLQSISVCPPVLNSDSTDASEGMTDWGLSILYFCLKIKFKYMKMYFKYKYKLHFISICISNTNYNNMYFKYIFQILAFEILPSTGWYEVTFLVLSTTCRWIGLLHCSHRLRYFLRQITTTPVTTVHENWPVYDDKTITQQCHFTA